MQSVLINLNKYGLSYFNMPKSACTTIKNIFYYLEFNKWFHDPLKIHKYIAFSNDNPFKTVENAANLKFTFVRHPGRRVFSAFIEKIWFVHSYSFPKIKKYLELEYGCVFSDQCRNPSIEHIQNQFECFLEFVEKNISNQSPFPSNPHWQSQYYRIRSLPPRHTLSYIGRVESFYNDMEMLLNRVGVKDANAFLHKKFNEGPPPPYKYEEILNENIAKKISKVYKIDFRAFGYNESF